MPDASRPHGLDDLYDIARLADRLGVEHATIRVWLSRKVPWLPPPDGRLNGGAVWRAETLAGLEDRRRPGRPGPKPRAAMLPLPVPADALVASERDTAMPFAGTTTTPPTASAAVTPLAPLPAEPCPTSPAGSVLPSPRSPRAATDRGP